MQQLLITLKDPSKANILHDFLKTLAYIEEVEWLASTSSEKPYENGAENEKAEPAFSDEKIDYTIQDIEAIARQFPADHPWTYQDLQEHFPEDLQIAVEILDQKLYIMPSPQEIHQEITFELCAAMKSHAKKHGLGKVIISPFDVVLNDNNVVIPDVIFVSVDNLPILDGKRANGSPDLIVEVWSPGNSTVAREKKREVYEQQAVKEFWSIFPKERSIKVEVLTNGKYQTFAEETKVGNIQSSVLKSFSIRVEDLMPDGLFE